MDDDYDKAREDTLYVYFKSRQFVLNLLSYRGYNSDDDINITFDDFVDLYRDLTVDEMKNDLLEDVYESDDDRRIMVSWEIPPKLGSTLPNVVKRMKDNNVTDAIIISDEGVTTDAKKNIKTLKTDGIRIWVWALNDTMVFPPHHALVPKHEICTSKEKRRVLDKYGKKPSQLPSINISDPMVKCLGASKGNLIRIHRPSETIPDAFDIHYSLVV